MIAPQPGLYRADLDAAVGALGMQVNRETVLKARAALLAEADRLDFELQRQWDSPDAGSLICGWDPVSPEAAAAFKERITDLFECCARYNKDLRQAARALDATARSYGYTDDEIASSFRSGQ